MAEAIDPQANPSPDRPSIEGKPVVLVPHYSAVEDECDKGLRALEKAGVTVRRASFSAIDLLRSVILSQALKDGFDRFLFIDSDIGFDRADAMRLLNRPEPVVAGVYMKKKERDFSGVFARGVDRVVFGPAAPGLYSMLYASAGFLRIKSEVLHRMIEELKLPRMPFRSGQGDLSLLSPLVRARWAGRNALPDRGLQLFAPVAPDRHHSHGRHVDPAISLRQIWV